MSLSNHRLAHKLCHRSMLFVGRYISVYELRIVYGVDINQVIEKFPLNNSACDIQRS